MPLVKNYNLTVNVTHLCYGFILIKNNYHKLNSTGYIKRKTQVYLFNNSDYSGLFISTTIGSSFLSFIESDIISEIALCGLVDYSLFEIIKNHSIQNYYVSQYKIHNNRSSLTCVLSKKTNKIEDLEKKIPKEVIFKQ